MKFIAVAALACAALLASGAAIASTKAKYVCKGGHTLTVTYNANKAKVSVPGAEPVTLTQALSGDGFLYTKKGYSLRGVGNKITWTPGRGKPLTCRAR